VRSTAELPADAANSEYATNASIYDEVDYAFVTSSPDVYSSPTIYSEIEDVSEFSSRDIPPSGIVTPYVGLEPTTREFVLVPSVYDTMTTPEYANDAASRMTFGSTNEEPGSDPETSSAVSQSSSVEVEIEDEVENVPGSSSNVDSQPTAASETSYSQLDSSTREPTPSPAVYDRITRPEYVNIGPNGATFEEQ